MSQIFQRRPRLAFAWSRTAWQHDWCRMLLFEFASSVQPRSCFSKRCIEICIGLMTFDCFTKGLLTPKRYQNTILIMRSNHTIVVQWVGLRSSRYALAITDMVRPRAHLDYCLARRSVRHILLQSYQHWNSGYARNQKDGARIRSRRYM